MAHGAVAQNIFRLRQRTPAFERILDREGEVTEQPRSRKARACLAADCDSASKQIYRLGSSPRGIESGHSGVEVIPAH